MLLIASVNSFLASFIKLEWNAPLTGRINDLLAPNELNTSQIFFTALISPDITTCPGQLKFAAITLPSNSWHVSLINLSSSPKIAAIVPLLLSHAFCIAFALRDTKIRPSLKEIVLFATRDENSPKECPATAKGLLFLDSYTINSAIECRKIAGCVTLVCFKSSSSPSNIIFERENFSRSSASSNNFLTSSLLWYKSCPIPLNWEPWPGNTNTLILYILSYLIKVKS